MNVKQAMASHVSVYNYPNMGVVMPPPNEDVYNHNHDEPMSYPITLFLLGIVLSAQGQNRMEAASNSGESLSALNAVDTMTDKLKAMKETKEKLNQAEQRTRELFKAVEVQGLIIPGKLESVLNAEIVQLAKERFGMANHWHKKIVRSGINTLQPYSGNPADRVIQPGDIVFLDFGPIFEGYEADLGRTYVLGNDPVKLKLKKDVEAAWAEAREWYNKQTHLTGAEYFNYVTALAKRYGYEFGGDIAGHIIGPFPHEQPDLKGDLSLDVHPDNHTSILLLDKHGNRRQWVLEIQFVDREKGIGAFFEQMLN